MSLAPNDVALKLQQAARNGELIVVIGSGVSIGLTNNGYSTLSWKGLVQDGLNYGKTKGKISPEQMSIWGAHLDSSDIDDLLGTAEFVGRKLGAPHGDLYARWMEGAFSNAKALNESLIAAIRAISQSQTQMCTLNYDSLLESITGLQTIIMSDSKRAAEWMRRDTQGILHLHGHWENPSSCVLGIRDYEETVKDEARGIFQKSLSMYKQLLFIGCGDTFADPNFSALITWLKLHMQSSGRQHYALVTDDQYETRQADDNWHGFVEPLSYGPGHSNLAEFLNQIFSTSLAPPKIKKASRVSSTEKNIEILQAYRDFLIKDCGQMTIEGVRADMDTAQRRFDLEKLFVPLDLLACPPEFLESDPDRREKLERWMEDNSKPIPFGKIFSESNGLALLALPGGGKTLLLKRLAVAYASPNRRSKSGDGLPEASLMPLLIRCREWRDYIKLPLMTLLQRLGDITGHPELSGLSRALIPLLKKGEVLLLVDGLDEIHDNADRETFVENLQKFLHDYPKIRVVVTSREAGFNLVAPRISEFCVQWKVAPLSTPAIKLLCDHWHELMAPGTPECRVDSAEMFLQLDKTPALRRLAENPLLLTMLLVVKHGAGRLPPDRVSLYGRAVEVLLNTWNIKGHEALDAKEAVPQLAYVALELMRKGMQTATEKELLALLDTARERVPHISRYAKGTPYEFLKRVELRSSLLLEAGHQIENGITVPFYQFRHLTFQEYLAAVAVAAGHYDGYQTRNTVLRPLSTKLVTEEWKEIIPMAAVLAGKQAGPLISALITKGKIFRKKLIEHKNTSNLKEWRNDPYKIPPPIARLFQILVEEAEIEPHMLEDALQLIILFSKGAQSPLDWRALSRGPFANELLHQTWLLYESLDWEDELRLRNSYAVFAAYSKQPGYLTSVEGTSELLALLGSQAPEQQCRGIMTFIGILWNREFDDAENISPILYAAVESMIIGQPSYIFCAAVWGWGLYRHHNHKAPSPPSNILDELLKKWLNGKPSHDRSAAAFGIKHCFGMTRASWTPVLSDHETEAIKIYLGITVEKRESRVHNYNYLSALLVSFHAGTVIDDHTLVDNLIQIRTTRLRLVSNASESLPMIDSLIKQIIPYGPIALKRDIAKKQAQERAKQKSLAQNQSPKI